MGGVKGYVGGRVRSRWNVPVAKGVEGGPMSVMDQVWMLESEGRVMVVCGGGEVVRSASSWEGERGGGVSELFERGGGGGGGGEVPLLCVCGRTWLSGFYGGGERVCMVWWRGGDL